MAIPRVGEWANILRKPEIASPMARAGSVALSGPLSLCVDSASICNEVLAVRTASCDQVGVVQKPRSGLPSRCTLQMRSRDSTGRIYCGSLHFSPRMATAKCVRGLSGRGARSASVSTRQAYLNRLRTTASGKQVAVASPRSVVSRCTLRCARCTGEKCQARSNRSDPVPGITAFALLSVCGRVSRGGDYFRSPLLPGG